MDSQIDIQGYAEAPNDFVALPYALYEGEPAWRPPLRMERASQIDARKNPAMAGIRPRFFVARRGGEAVGRIAAFLNSAHDERYGDEAGFFGYFDCLDDPAVEDALLEAAKDWVRELGRTRLIGPAMWSVNEECGLLVDGFEHPPAVMMPYGRAHQVAALDRHGFTKVVDLLAYRADLSDGAPETRMVRAMCALAERDEGITWRSMDRANFKQEVALAMDIFNDGWSGNWGFLPFPQAQIDHMAAEMKPIMFDEGFWVAVIDGEPAAFLWMIPDVNEAVRDFSGRLLPFNWAKLLWRLKRKQVTKARIPLMGIRKRYHNTRRGLAAVAKLCQMAFDAGHANGFTQCELSWILEDNEGIKAICEQAGADAYKRYRIFACDL